MKAGFTGTRHGMTESQKERLRKHLVDMGVTEFHHGDCVGADEQAHFIAMSLGIDVVVHPPIHPASRAFTEGTEERSQKGYLDRNRAIVNESDVVFAAPGESVEVLRSGTWMTIRYAKKTGRGLTIIFPEV